MPFPVLEALPCTLQEKLDSLRKGQTTVIVAHRLSTVMDADIIIVMQVSKMSCALRASQRVLADLDRHTLSLKTHVDLQPHVELHFDMLLV